jgi:iron complex outermembrane receptor protein
VFDRLIRPGLICLLLTATLSAANPPESGPEDLLFTPLPVVEAAALHAQTLEAAPAAVTVISAAEIRRYGYRTLGEALGSVRGFFSSYDQIYHYMGVRGFSPLGDFNTRFLVMLNGHPLTDGVYNSNGAFGEDFPLDMDVVDRIEVIRGPTSALYGSNGILANVNIITRSPVDGERLRAGIERGSGGEKKVTLGSSAYLGKGANLLLSASVFNNGGDTLRFPGVADGPVAGLDGERGEHLFANLVWHEWSFFGLWSDRQKTVPVPWGDGAQLFDRGNQTHDRRALFFATYSHASGADRHWEWRISYDQYRYRDRFDYPLADGSSDGWRDRRSLANSDAIGSQLTYSLPVGRVGPLVLGAEVNAELRNVQQDYDVAPTRETLPAISHPDQTGAVFAQQQWQIAHNTALYGGVRLDVSREFGASVSPRLALVENWRGSTYKLVYGRPFRNPSAFEAYYTDGGQSYLANPSLRAETAHTFEASAERKLSKTWSAVANLYHYRLGNLIQADFLPGDVQQYGNDGQFHSTGIEGEVTGRSPGGLEAVASYSYQRSLNVGTGAASGNVPSHIAKFRGAAPLAQGRLSLAATFDYLSTRATRDGTSVRPVALVGVTLTTNRIHRDFDVQVGVRNLAGWRYWDPAAVALDPMPGDGRSVYIKLLYHRAE